jgi:hypothetical protein
MPGVTSLALSLSARKRSDWERTGFNVDTKLYLRNAITQQERATNSPSTTVLSSVYSRIHGTRWLTHKARLQPLSAPI